MQWAAVAIAAAGIAVLAAGAGTTLWISLTLCFSFATYGLLRKIIHGRFAGRPDRSRPPCSSRSRSAGCCSAARGAGRCSGPRAETMAADGGRRRLDGAAALLHRGRPALPIRPSACSSSFAPTLQFLLAVAVYDEPFTRAHAIAFGCIWTALRSMCRRWSATCAARARMRRAGRSLSVANPRLLLSLLQTGGRDAELRLADHRHRRAGLRGGRLHSPCSAGPTG